LSQQINLTDPSRECIVCQIQSLQQWRAIDPLHSVITTLFEAQTLFVGTHILHVLAWQLKLGTAEQNEAQNEFMLRPYINTDKKEKTSW